MLMLSDLRTAVYTEIGSPSEVDMAPVENGIIDKKIQFAGRTVARRRGGRSEDVLLAYIEASAGISEYAIPAGREVDEVFWASADFANFPTYDSGLFANQFGNIPYSSIYPAHIYSRADQLIAEMKAAQMLDSRYRAEVFAGKIHISPEAVTEGTRIYYTYRLVQGELTDIPDKCTNYTNSSTKALA